MSFLYPCSHICLTNSPSEKYLKKLLGKTEIEDALTRLDKITQEEVRMATAQLLALTDGVDNKVTRIDDEIKSVGDAVRVVQNGARSVIFPIQSLVNVYAARWKGNSRNRATYGKQRQRSDEYVVQ